MTDIAKKVLAIAKQKEQEKNEQLLNIREQVLTLFRNELEKESPHQITVFGFGESDVRLVSCSIIGTPLETISANELSYICNSIGFAYSLHYGVIHLDMNYNSYSVADQLIKDALNYWKPKATAIVDQLVEKLNAGDFSSKSNLSDTTKNYEIKLTVDKKLSNPLLYQLIIPLLNDYGFNDTTIENGCIIIILKEE